MPTYSYVAKTAAGGTERGTTQAEDEQVLRKRLEAQGYFPTEVKEVQAAQGAAGAKEEGKRRKPLISFGRVKGKDLAVFCRLFSTMMNAGITLIRCLTVLEQQVSSYALREVIKDLQLQVEAGESLSKAMQRHPRVFGDLFIGLVRAGEVGGVLDETLQRLADFLEKDQELKRKIKSAMAYPIIVTIACVGITILIVTFVVPRFMDLFQNLDVGGGLPWCTVTLMNISNFCVLWVLKRAYVTWPLLIGGYILFRKWKTTKSGKRIWDFICLKFPVFGMLNHKVAIGRMARTLATLLGSGVPVLSAMETTAGAVNNEVIASAIMNARTAIREGEEIAKPLEESGWFPPMVVQMVSIGEETGALDELLGKIADFYESEVEAMLEALTSMLEPVIFVGMGVVVLFIAWAVFGPMAALIESLSQ